MGCLCCIGWCCALLLVVGLGPYLVGFTGREGESCFVVYASVRLWVMHVDAREELYLFFPSSSCENRTG